MSKCIVVGGTGFIGSSVVQEATNRGYDVISITRSNYKEHLGSSADVLVNAAGNSKKFIDSQDPVTGYKLSVDSTMDVLHDFSFGLYVQLSSGAIYPNEGNPLKNSEMEELHPSAMTRYGFHKRMAEQLVEHYASDYLILRMGGFVGPGLKKNAVYDILTGGGLFVHPDSEFQYMDSRDLAKSVFALAESRTCNRTITNLSAKGVITIKEVAEEAGVVIPNEAFKRPRVRAELNLDKAGCLLDLPITAQTVKRFIKEFQEGAVGLFEA